jgi:hypothetical protein
MGTGTPRPPSPADLRQEIERLASQQQRNLEYLWTAAERRFGCDRTALTVEQLEQMVKGLTERGTAA